MCSGRWDHGAALRDASMAKLGEGDARWIVDERADGANVNGWHCASRDAMRCGARDWGVGEVVWGWRGAVEVWRRWEKMTVD